jgi:hypothetical protein
MFSSRSLSFLKNSYFKFSESSPILIIAWSVSGTLFWVFGHATLSWKLFMLFGMWCHPDIEGLGIYSTLPNLCAYLSRNYTQAAYFLWNVVTISVLDGIQTEVGVCCWCFETISVLKGNLSPGLSQLQFWCIVQNEPGEYPEAVAHLHKPFPGAGIGPNAPTLTSLLPGTVGFCLALDRISTNGPAQDPLSHL